MRKASFFAVPLLAVLGQVAVGQTSTNYTDAAKTGVLTPAPVTVTPAVTPGTQDSSVLVWYTDRPTFMGSVGGLCNSEDFEASTTPSVQLHAEPLWVCTSDPAISVGDIEGGLAIESSGGNGVVTLAAGLIGQPSVVAGANTFAEYTVLNFCNEPFAVGMDLYSNGGAPDPVEVRVYDCNNVLLGMMTFGANAGTGTFAGVEATAGMGPIWRIEVESLTGAGELVDDMLWNGYCSPILGADKKYISSGDSVTLAVSEAGPNSRGLLFVTCVNGSPFIINLGILFPVPGTACLGPFPVPTVTPGISVGLNAFISDGSSISITNKKTLFFQ